MQRAEKDVASTSLCFTWELCGAWGKIICVATASLSPHSSVARFSLSISNQTDLAIWEVQFPQVSGLREFDHNSQLALPRQMGELYTAPVAHVNGHAGAEKYNIKADFGTLNVPGETNIIYSYPGMYSMQFLAYGSAREGGLYMATEDGQALYKVFGMTADAGDGKHAAVSVTQYPEDRTALGADFASFYETAIGLYHGQWWDAADLYRDWALDQLWCRSGPTAERKDISDRVKSLDAWYWNWQCPDFRHPVHMVPAVRSIKKRFDCNLAFHWYGYNGEVFDTDWRYPEMVPENKDIRSQLADGVQAMHELDVLCVPYINCRLWNPRTQSFRDADGMNCIAVDANGMPSHTWLQVGHTICPVGARPFHDLINAQIMRLADELGMDGAYMDQITSCYAVPCFNPSHDHGAGGHDHWCRGYREMVAKVRRELKSRNPDSIITSEAVMECFLDLFDADLELQLSMFKRSAQPIPLFHSVYHDYHMTYGTRLTFEETNRELFRYAQAYCLVSGQQLMVSAYYAGNENNDPRKREYLDYMDTLVQARKASRRWLNLGRWRPPLPIDCDDIELEMPDARRLRVPAVVNGCFEIDQRLCAVFVNHTPESHEVRLRTEHDNGHGQTPEFSWNMFMVLHPDRDMQTNLTKPDYLCIPAFSAVVLVAAENTNCDQG